MLGYLSADIICSEKRTVFLERSSRKTVSYEEQIMSKDKYPSIFSPQMATIVFIIPQIFFATREVLKIGEHSRIFSSFSWEIFGHVTRLNQSRASEKISWIISSDICPWTLSVPRSSRFFSSDTLGKLFASRNRHCPRTSIRACLRAKRRLFIIYTSAFLYLVGCRLKIVFSVTRYKTYM